MGDCAAMFRLAQAEDVEPIGLLASHVFLDTYVPQGVSRAIASEVRLRFSREALLARLQDPGVRILLAEDGEWLLGFADLSLSAPEPRPGVQGAEVLRLYVHPRHQGQGVGRRLLQAAETLAQQAGATGCWLSAWEGNSRALAFYPRQGYRDVGETDYCIDGQAYRNRVFSKMLPGPWTTPTTD